MEVWVLTTISGIIVDVCASEELAEILAEESDSWLDITECEIRED